MSFDSSASDVMIELVGASKHYPVQIQPVKRMWQALLGRRLRQDDAPSYTALEPCNLTVRRGEVIGLVGKNGAGKSTLLQLVSATVQPSGGVVNVNGKISAILELGAGFNPEFSGRENIHLATATAGLSGERTNSLLDEIIEFSGIRAFIDQPIKTYSSGMVVRLAFSIATCTEPDVLIIDEALSVGDGEFARKSFDRILELKDRGATILFCSHSLFQIESICTRAIWLHRGKVVAEGNPAQVVSVYQEFLDRAEDGAIPLEKSHAHASAPKGFARLTQVLVGGLSPGQGTLSLVSGRDNLEVYARFSSDPSLPCPSIAITLHTPDGRLISSAGAWNDGFQLERSVDGKGDLTACFQEISLLKGRYYLSVHLFCERGLHIYDVADRVMYLMVSQNGLEQGLFHMPRTWSSSALAGQPERQIESPLAENGALLDWLSSSSTDLKLGESIACPAPLVDGLDVLAARFGLKPQADGTFIKTRLPRWTLAWIRSKKCPPDWLKLFEACFQNKMSENLWHWKYGEQDIVGVGVYASSGQMVAFYGALPRSVIYFGRPVMAVQVGDVMVHPSERGVLTREGPFALSCKTFLEQMIGFQKPYLIGFGFPSRKALEVASRLKIYSTVDQMSEVNWPVQKLGPDWFARSKLVSMADEAAVNACWSDMANAMKDSVLGVRDWQFLVRRFLQHPQIKYSVLIVRSRFSAKVFGVVVLRDREQDGLELIDVIGEPLNFPVLVRSALRHAHLLGRSRLFAWVTASHQERLNVWGAKFTPIDVWIPTNVWSPGPSVAELSGRWWLMGGDTDFR